jgi:hypothetical protein
MLRLHGSNLGAHIVRNGKRVRGYPRVALAGSQDEGDGTYAPRDEDMFGAP